MSRPPDDVRFGNRGTISVNYTTGQWYDFRTGVWRIKELIRVYKEIDDRDAAIAHAEQCQQNLENDDKSRPNGNAKAGQHHQREGEATYPYPRRLRPSCLRGLFVPSISRARITSSTRAASASNLQPAPALRIARPELVVGTRCWRVHAPGTRKGLDSFQRY